MKNETVLYGVMAGEPDWAEVILSTNPARFEEIKVLAAKDGFGRFREAVIDLSKPPDFAAAALAPQKPARKKRALKCDSCGIVSPEVRKTVDPYEAEVHGKDVPGKLCKACWKALNDEV